MQSNHDNALGDSSKPSQLKIWKIKLGAMPKPPFGKEKVSCFLIMALGPEHYISV